MFDANEVIQSTQEFATNTSGALSQSQTNYASFYGIDFRANPNIKHQMGHFHVDEHRLFAQTFVNTQQSIRGTLLIMHGYMDHMGLFGNTIRYGLSRNFQVVGFDLPGHGLSSGAKAEIGDFMIYQHLLKAWFERIQKDLPKPWFLLGQSTGAAIAIDYLLMNRFTAASCPFKAVAFFAPLVRPCHWLKVKMMHRFLSPFLTHVKREFKSNTNNPSFNQFLKEQDPLQPRKISGKWVGAMFDYVTRIESAVPIELSPMVIQGTLDKTVNFKHNLEVIKQKFAHPEVVYLEGAGHHLANETDTYQAQTHQALDRSFQSNLK